MSAHGRLAFLLAAAALAPAASGCGSERVRELPPAAGPARAPALTATPAGRVVAADAVPGGDGSPVRAVVGDRTFVGHERDDTMSVLEGGREIRRVRVAAQPGGLAATGGDVAVVSLRERVLELYDARTLRRVARLPVGVGPTHVVAGAAGYLYVADTHGGALLVVATRPRPQVVRRVFLPGAPYGLALDADRRRLWVTLTARNQLVGLTATSHPREVARLPTVRQADRVAVDSALGTVAVTSRDAGVVQRIGAREAYGEDER